MSIADDRKYLHRTLQPMDVMPLAVLLLLLLFATPFAWLGWKGP